MRVMRSTVWYGENQRVEWDGEAQESYVYILTPEGDVARTVEITPSVRIDIDEFGNILGVEVDGREPHLSDLMAVLARCSFMEVPK